MPATVLTVAQRKGGAGKTTLAIHLAVAFQELGLAVAGLDLDPQASFGRWHQLRRTRLAGAAEPLTVAALAGWRVGAEVDRLRRAHDLVLIDTPPTLETDARNAMRAADLVIVPMQPTLMDLWATGAVIELVGGEGRAGLIVLNRVPPRSRTADQVIAEARALGVPVAAAAIGNRVALGAALAHGAAITETGPATSAAEEIRALATELLAAAKAR